MLRSALHLKSLATAYGLARASAPLYGFLLVVQAKHPHAFTWARKPPSESLLQSGPQTEKALQEGTSQD